MDQTFQKSLQAQLAEISQGLSHLLPEAILSAILILLLLWELLRKKPQGSGMLGFTLVGLILCACVIPHGNSHILFEGNLVSDGISHLGKYLFLGSGIVSLCFFKFQQGGKSQPLSGEYYLLFTGLILGLFFLSMSVHFLYLYLSLELISICSYLLTAHEATHQKQGSKQAESAIKYIIFGAASSGIMLYGISWMYGFTGTLLPTSSDYISALQEVPEEAQILAFTLIFAGFLFKVAAFPFHFWAPDVYEGISFPLAGFFSVAPKAAGFLALFRMLYHLQKAEIFPKLLLILGILALAGMTLGNLLALRQKNIKRLLAYSGIAHAGFILMALVCLPGTGSAAMLFYLAVYALLNLSAFILGDFFSSVNHSENFHDWAGTGKISLGAGFLFALCLAGLIGLPPTGGFIAKWYVFVALFEQIPGSLGNFGIILLIGALLNTLISIFFYLSPLISLFLKPIKREISPGTNTFVLIFCAGLLLPALVLGMYGFDQFINLLQNILWN